jgi:hypothetical protein
VQKEQEEEEAAIVLVDDLDYICLTWGPVACCGAAVGGPALHARDGALPLRLRRRQQRARSGAAGPERSRRAPPPSSAPERPMRPWPAQAGARRGHSGVPFIHTRLFDHCHLTAAASPSLWAREGLRTAGTRSLVCEVSDTGRGHLRIRARPCPFEGWGSV